MLGVKQKARLPAALLTASTSPSAPSAGEILTGLTFCATPFAGERRAENARRTLSEHDSAAPPAGPAARVTVSANDSGLGVGRRRPSRARTGAEAEMAPSTMWGYLSLSHAADAKRG